MNAYIKRSKTQIAILGLIQVLIQTAGFLIFTSDESVADDGVDGNIAWNITGDTLTLSVQEGQAGTDMRDYTNGRPLWEGVAGWNNVSKVVINDGVSTVGNYACYICRSLTSVTIGDSVLTIGDYAFDTCTSLTSVTFGSGVTSVGLGAFESCTSLRSVTIINSGTTSIGAGAFYNCSSLTSVALGNNVTLIGESAFQGSISLTSVTFGSGVTSVGQGAFDLDMDNRRAFYDLDGNELTQDAANLAGKMFVGETQSALYQVTDGGAIGNISWYITQNTLYINPTDPATPTAMPDFTASDRPAWIQSGYWSSVTDVVIVNNITTVGNYAFYAHTAITSITIPNSVTEIGASAFRTSGLQSITFGTGLTTIGQDVFRSCGQLTSITIPDSVTSIGQACFYSCSSLQSITFGNGLTEIPLNTSAYCRALTNVVLSDSITTIGQTAFQNCSALTSISLKNVQTIGTEQFKKAGINNLTIPDSVASIGEGAFREMPNLTDIAIGKGLTSIPANMCRTCPLLASVIIPNTITSIGSEAFRQSGSSASMQVYAQSETPATIGTNQFTSYTGFVIWVSEQSLTDYKTNWATWEQNIQAVPHVTISVPTSLNISVYGGQTITPIIAEDTKWYSDLTFTSQDSTLVSVDNDGNLTAYGTVSIAQITVSVYEWFYEQNATVRIDVNVIYNAESNVDVISGFEYNYTLTPSVTPATIELYGTAANWVSVVDDYTIYGIVPADITDLNDLIVVQRTIQPDQTYSWHITFTMVDYLEVEIGDNATADVYPNGKVVILGSGQTYADALIPYANLITVVDIRGLTTITDGTLPLCANPITIILGDSVQTFADNQNNIIENLVIGAGLTTIPNGITLYDQDNKRITDAVNARGHIFVKSNTNDTVMYQADSTTTSNYYNDATCYAVKGKTLNNSEKDRLKFLFSMLKPVSTQTQAFIGLSEQTWGVTMPAGSGFSNVEIGKDGVLIGKATNIIGTYNGKQVHNIVNDEYENSDYLCSLSPSAIEFTVFVQKELIIN